jgi:phosphocarrier protein HPr
MAQREITISQQTRPACPRRRQARQHRERLRAEVFLDKAGQKVNGKSIMGVMMLAASQGTMLTLKSRGTTRTQR